MLVWLSGRTRAPRLGRRCLHHSSTSSLDHFSNFKFAFLFHALMLPIAQAGSVFYKISILEIPSDFAICTFLRSYSRADDREKHSSINKSINLKPFVRQGSFLLTYTLRMTDTDELVGEVWAIQVVLDHEAIVIPYHMRGACAGGRRHKAAVTNVRAKRK